MRTFLIIQSILLVLCDISLIISCFIFGGSGLFFISYFNIFFGIVQFFPALVMLFKKRFRTKTLLVYIFISLLLIGGVYVMLEKFDEFELGSILMLISYVIAHLYIPLIKRVIFKDA